MYAAISDPHRLAREGTAMLNHLSDFLCGWRKITISPDERVRAFDLLYQNAIPFTDEKRGPDGTITVRVRGKYTDVFRHYADEAGIVYQMTEPYGMPVIRSFLQYRPAVPLGILLCVVWMFYSTRIIWDVQIDGAEKTDPAEIIALLDELGCGVGDYYPSIDFNDLHAKYSAVQQDIAWLSVYMNGTVAEVQVREMWKDERIKPAESTYANVFADADGIVESVNVFEGQACVKAGDLVRKGQVLISGIIEQKDGSIRYEYASGEVICRTAHPIHVEIQTKRETKAYTGRETIKKSIKFFKKTINLFINGGTLYTNYDKIYTIEQLCPLGLCELPVWYEKTTYREYEPVSRDIPADDAADEAMAALTEQVKAATQNAELLSKTIDTGFSDGIYNIDCLLYLRRDIGRTGEFSVSDTCVPDAGENPGETTSQ